MRQSTIIYLLLMRTPYYYQPYAYPLYASPENSMHPATPSMSPENYYYQQYPYTFNYSYPPIAGLGLVVEDDISQKMELLRVDTPDLEKKDSNLTMKN